MQRSWCCSQLGLAFFVLQFVFGPWVFAEERIVSFHSDIEIAQDSSMVVRETIRVVAESKDIRRGIFREFPTTYKDRYGNSVKVKFRVTEVTRDGLPEPWHKKRRANGLRIYIGKSDNLLIPDEYTYTITYKTKRQIGFFSTHDELYWNVTGNGWSFPIESASATVTLPSALNTSDISLAGYTGRRGSKDNFSISTVSSDGGTITTTKKLAANAGLTLVLSWPKGVVDEPSDLQRLGYLLIDNLGLLLSLVAFLGSALYLYVMWSRYGRDPKKGAIFPHYAPPEGYSPAAARYINKRGYDKETFTAAILNLAVKGHISITCIDKEYSLRRLTSSEPLSNGESAMIHKLFREGTMLALDNSNHEQVSASREAHKRSLRKDYLEHYFKTNGLLLLPSLLVSAFLLMVVGATGLVVTLAVAFFAATFLVHIVFSFLMEAPSRRGRRLMDKLEGFKLYLEVAEKDDLNLRNPPDLTPQLFEKYLPYAIALGVEQEWSEKFSELFARMDAQPGTGYHPVWYHGNFDAHRINTFSSNIGSDFSSAISSAATPPGSTSGGGGGGFSGGGGGGGGGGGW